VAHSAFFCSCWRIPTGGRFPPAGGKIIDALTTIAMREGVTIRCNASVGRILIRAGRVVGARLRDGEELTARDVVPP
jgi:phytoene dehydrogenase-like protein